MNQNLKRGLAIGIPLIILGLVLLGFFLRGCFTKTSQAPVTAPGATAPAPGVEKLPPATAETIPPQQPEAPAVTTPAPPQKAAPAPGSASPAPQVTPFPPEKQTEHFGFLVNRYRQYGAASKMQDKLKKQGIYGFIQPSPKHPGLNELWVGPFSDRAQAKAAQKRLRDLHLLKGARKIHQIPGTVPK